MPEQPATPPPEALVPTETPDARVEPGAAVAGGAAAGPTTASDDPAELRRQRDQYYELLLRTAAEFDNYRKRVERERTELAGQLASELVAQLLPIVDDFERALRAEAPGSDEAYRRGIELIYQNLLDLLRRWGVRPIDAVGTLFDPRLHQAVAYEETPGHRDGEVVEEYRRGYTLGSKLLRPSVVKVAKA
jgi:molecular chaperone GrpE